MEDSSFDGNPDSAAYRPQDFSGKVRHRILVGFAATFVLLTGILSASLVLFRPFPILQAVHFAWIFVIMLTASAVGYWITLQLVNKQMQKIQQSWNTEMAKHGDLLDYILRVFHVLGSPLAVILGYAEMLSESELRNKESFLDTLRQVIVKESWRISTGMENAASLINLEMTGYVMKMAPCPLASVLEEAAEITGKKAGQTVHFSNQAGKIMIEGDVIWLKEAFSHLISNLLNTASSPISVNLDLDKDLKHVKIVLRTDSFELTNKDKTSISEGFESFKSSSKRDVAGGSLGYYLANQIIRQHRGQILIDSQPGQGSTITVMLPKNHLETQDEVLSYD